MTVDNHNKVVTVTNEPGQSTSDIPGTELADHVRELAGICPILIVPFDEAGAVDLVSFERQVHYVCDAGAPGMTLFGLASEYYKLDDGERMALVETLVRGMSVHPYVNALVSVTDHSLEVATLRAQQYVAMGVRMINVLPPFFLGPRKTDVLAHIEAVCAAVPNAEIMLQYAPEFTGTTFAPQEVAAIADRHPNLRYAKVEVQPPASYIHELLVASGGRVQSLIGYQGLFAPQVLAHGAIGIQPGPALTDVYLRLWASLRQDPPNEDLYRSLLPYVSYWMQDLELAIAVEKSILQRRGIIASDYCRRPARQLGSFDYSMIEAVLREFGLG